MKQTQRCRVIQGLAGTGERPMVRFQVAAGDDRLIDGCQASDGQIETAAAVLFALVCYVLMQL
ncbi:hypothetical protein FRX31_013543 [Thalictrum thalictroides]|uniref:Uncharacterized protein n=1 Tax=Thalictrum thalictroides TaxID=46969 RepID=A0A7J6WIV1_THATH|nr:hypothetical protein FRX31_013543 [Thalictrum thalictroides]